MKYFCQIPMLFLISLLMLLPHEPVSAGIHSYANSSVLAQGKFVKIRIKESGVYKLTYDDLNSMGINPANVRIFGYGGKLLEQSFLLPKLDDLPEIAIHMEKGQDGVFGSGDYILFYAQGVNSWSYDSSKKMYTHVLNYYSSYGYYFVTSDAGEGRKITEEEAITPPESAVVNNVSDYIDYSVYENELISLINSGKEFYGETFTPDFSLTMNASVTDILKRSNAVRVRLDVAAASDVTTNFSLTLGGEQTKNLSVAMKSDNIYEVARSATGIYDFTPTSDLLGFKLSYSSTSSLSKGYLNFLEVNVRRSLIMTGAVLTIQNPDYLGTDSYNRYHLTTTNSNVQIWDITDQINVKKVNTTAGSGELTFLSYNKTQKYYLAINPASSSSFSKPEIVGTVANQNLHALPQTDMIIITYPAFLQHAQRLADEHNSRGEVSVNVVTTEQVYNEFSSGTPDATAYRWLMKMLYDRAEQMGDESRKPRYLLLFGRGSYDNRQVISTSTQSYVLTYQAENSLEETLSYVTDDYYAFLEDSEGTQVASHTMDIGIGRLPVMTTQEASNVVTKLINYMNNPGRGIWKNQVCYLADDGDNALHMEQADTVASAIARTNPEYQINKIYLDAYKQEVNASGESYPVARTQFHNLLRNGMLVLDYTGHAGSAGWASEKILTLSDVKSLSNENLPMWIGATCYFLQFDNSKVSAGENVILNSVGGGIGIISATRPVYASQNKNINKYLNEFIFLKENGKHLRMGDVVMRAKNKLKTEINKLSYVYVGDPALRLNYPDDYKVVISKINGNDVLGNDTLQALSEAVVEGYITDQDGNVMDDFNGFVYGNVYDKVQKIVTLNNDGESKGSLTYYDRPNRLFSGQSEVVDGKFSFKFMLPRDIKYNYGTGRLNFYAYDVDNSYEAIGTSENLLIGGSNDSFEYETDGPEISMYLNSTDFTPGGKVNESPLFIAEVSDINGVNQVGSGIGHDMVLTVDDDPMQSYILNDYYNSAIGDYTNGTVRFKLSNLKSGKHTLTFRVWDLLNNSSSKSMDFEVVKGLEPVIFKVSNYPNPVETYTKFVIEHDRPETVVSATVDIFDLSGRKIWSFTQSTVNEITWYASDFAGQQLKTGIYLYRVSITDNSEAVYSKINKFIFTGGAQ